MGDGRDKRQKGWATEGVDETADSRTNIFANSSLDGKKILTFGKEMKQGHVQPSIHDANEKARIIE